MLSPKCCFGQRKTVMFKGVFCPKSNIMYIIVQCDVLLGDVWTG